MREILTLAFTLLFLTNVSAQVEKTFVKSFNMNGNNFVVLKFQGNVEVKEWTDDFMRVHTNVVLENASSEALKLFLMQGRYNLKPGFEDGSFTISSMPRKANIKYRGQVLEEKVSYTVFVPENVEAQIYNDGTETSVIFRSDASIAN